MTYDPGDKSSFQESRRLPRSVVASGSFLFSRGKSEILEAYLATCVGVTLCDPQTNVGGLIHILLPEPTDKSNPWRPEIYASTGLPLFIRALCEAGALKERMLACVAGGALVAPVSGIDLKLDVGGRTLEVVREVLNRERIQVVKSETGGFFSCRLGLNLRDWSTIIEPIGSNLCELPSQESLNGDPGALDEAVESVRPIPQIVLKLMRMLGSDNFNMMDLAKEILRDQVLSARIIRVCNSTLISPKSRIDSVERAVVLLGEDQLLRAVLATSMGDFYSQSGQNYSLCKGVLYKHAVGTAMLCQRLSHRIPETLSDVAYTAGLLHDIGKVVLDHYPRNPHVHLYRDLRGASEGVLFHEKEIFGVCHTEAGARLAKHWQLSESLVESIRFHHDPESATINSALVHLVHLADNLISGMTVGEDWETSNAPLSRYGLAGSGLDWERLNAIVEGISYEILNS